jgi:hypothetical protein
MPRNWKDESTGGGSPVKYTGGSSKPPGGVNVGGSGSTPVGPRLFMGGDEEEEYLPQGGEDSGGGGSGGTTAQEQMAVTKPIIPPGWSFGGGNTNPYVSNATDFWGNTVGGYKLASPVKNPQTPDYPYGYIPEQQPGQTQGNEPTDFFSNLAEDIASRAAGVVAPIAKNAANAYQYASTHDLYGRLTQDPISKGTGNVSDYYRGQMQQMASDKSFYANKAQPQTPNRPYGYIPEQRPGQTQNQASNGLIQYMIDNPALEQQNPFGTLSVKPQPSTITPPAPSPNYYYPYRKYVPYYNYWRGSGGRRGGGGSSTPGFATLDKLINWRI